MNTEKRDKVKAIFGEESDIAQRLEASLCPICGKKVDIKKFKDRISKREYEISGMCQSCQDKIFK
jgi:hypothetical protein